MYIKQNSIRCKPCAIKLSNAYKLKPCQCNLFAQVESNMPILKLSNA